MKFRTFDAVEIEINPPLLGYTVNANMALKWQKAKDGSWSCWDNGVANDYRELTGCEFELTRTKTAELLEFFKNSSKGRGENIIMDLGEEPTGFFPFGPDYGDKSQFVVRIVDELQSGQLQQPYKYFKTVYKIILIQGHVNNYYPPAVAQPQGVLTFGNVSSLMFPQDLAQPESFRNYSHVVTQTGIPYVMDGPATEDNWETSFTLQMNAINAYSVMKEITQYKRSADIVVSCPNDFCLFGADNTATSFTTKLPMTQLQIKHDFHDRFSLPIRLWKVN